MITIVGVLVMPYRLPITESSSSSVGKAKSLIWQNSCVLARVVSLSTVAAVKTLTPSGFCFSQALYSGKALRQCGPDNVAVDRKGNRQVRDDSMPLFEYADGVHLAIQLPPPSTLFSEHKTHQGVRKELLRVARTLMREAPAKDERAFQRCYPARVGK